MASKLDNIPGRLASIQVMVGKGRQAVYCPSRVILERDFLTILYVDADGNLQTEKRPTVDLVSVRFFEE